MEQYETVIIYALFTVLVVFTILFMILKFLPFLERRENLSQKKEVLNEAKKQYDTIIAEAKLQATEHDKILQEELESTISEEIEELKNREIELEEQEKYFSQEESRVHKKEHASTERASQLEKVKSRYQEMQGLFNQSQLESIKHLENRARLDANQIKNHLSQQNVENRQLECQKVLKSLNEELTASSRKKAQRVLDRVHSRYSPNFVWPKAVNVVEVNNEKIIQELTNEGHTLLDELAEISETTIKLLDPTNDQKTPNIIKLAGGYGIFREAARLTLVELLATSPRQRNHKAKAVYDKHKQKIEHEAVLLGKEAIRQLRLEKVHPEIQKLVGALNWRTSYRQNQWHHTVEVAVFAGILATELGIDPDEAKRVGLLHDIGKAIDYRIEGSHAVISGDYADRYGETRMICDTVMSHHADLLVESPLAYVLRAADTLSGARPGARVNLEEGYQIRLDAIAEAVKSFNGIADFAIMNGGREVHIQVDHKIVSENNAIELTKAIAKKIEDDVAYPGQIKVMVSRSYESNSVA